MLEMSFGFKALGPAVDLASIASVINTDKLSSVFTLG